LFDEYGDYWHWVDIQSTEVIDSLADIIDHCVHAFNTHGTSKYDIDTEIHEIEFISNTTLALSDEDVLPSTTQPVPLLQKKGTTKHYSHSLDGYLLIPSCT